MRALWTFLLLLAACSGDDGTTTTDTGGGSTVGDDDDDDDDVTGEHPAAACAGPHSGSYSGDDAGLTTADLQADGTLVVTFGTSFGDVDSPATVAENGDVSGTEGTVTIEGTYDFGACSCQGTWQDAMYGNSGTWQLSKN